MEPLLADKLGEIQAQLSSLQTILNEVRDSHVSANPILNIEFFAGDLQKNITIRDYLKALLRQVWEEGEGFSGKRPFGNSGWECDLAVPLLKQGYITGTWEDEESEWLGEFDNDKYQRLILQCIDDL